MITYKHIFFDMDGTVTRTRSPIAPELKAYLGSIQESGISIIIISGQSVSAIQSQVGVGDYFMGQNGNQTLENATKKELWHNVLSDEEKEQIMSHIESIPRDWEVQDESKLVEDRHSQIAYSLIGFNQEITKKESFDPGGLRRAKLLVDHPLVSDSVEVKIAGTTTLDYFKKGHHKGKNIAKLIDLLGWERSECVYIGDQLYKGGNDEDVIGVIETREVKNPSETEAVFKEIL